ncbi:MFS transporter [Agrococcus jejuensis]|uniref:Putative proline/betaine transporter n=1 Tax=Agrococcus jejuensis TaxID=399736 RepID=A0A1G8F8R2_9MICO|nr:MFS transporter [Agrococcus jejuensis]SDH78536.1 metabolite-proton symporter [Agrococcus jejuensis]
MADASPTTTAEKPANSRGRVIFASLIGTSIEFYDFYIYATAAVLVFPALFFPAENETAQLLSSLATFGVAFVARPIGSILFGHFGDRIGRKTTLVASLLTMGIATVLIGCLPTALTPGWEIAAPALLALMRFCQGLGLGGEWSGAALLATENAPAGKRAIYGTFPQLGAPIGFILANTIFIAITYTLTPEQFQQFGWRIPFLLSAILVAVGLYVRLKLIETPAFTKVVERNEVVKVPLGRVFKHNWVQLIQGTLIMFATYVLFYLMTTFTLTFGTRAATEEQAAAAAEAAGQPFNPDTFVPGLGFQRIDFLWLLIIGVVFFGIFTLVAGPLAERFGRKWMLAGVSALIVVFGLLWVPLFGSGFVGIMLALILGFTLMGLTFGPMAAFLPELFPANVRYTGSALAYNLSSVIGAAPASFVAVALWGAAGGSPLLVGLYLSAAAAITLVVLLVSKDTRDNDYVNTTSA